MPSLLFVAAHPDDVETAASGTVRRALRRGWDVKWCILTDEQDNETATLRRCETLRAAETLGLKREHVLFLGEPDGNLHADARSVFRLRRRIADMNWRPDLVATHTVADSHNDHQNARRLTLAAFRRTVVLGFPVVNSLNSSEFRPSMFVNIDQDVAEKRQALACHSSQNARGRILWTDLSRLEERFGPIVGAKRAEAFTITVQEGAAIPDFMHELNDSLFHCLWNHLAPCRYLDIVDRLSRMRGPEITSARVRLINAFLADREGGASLNIHLATEVEQRRTPRIRAILALGDERCNVPTTNGETGRKTWNLAPTKISPGSGALVVTCDPAVNQRSIICCAGSNERALSDTLDFLHEPSKLKSLLRELRLHHAPRDTMLRLQTRRVGNEAQIVHVETIASDPCTRALEIENAL